MGFTLPLLRSSLEGGRFGPRRPAQPRQAPEPPPVLALEDIPSEPAELPEREADSDTGGLAVPSADADVTQSEAGGVADRCGFANCSGEMHTCCPVCLAPVCNLHMDSRCHEHGGRHVCPCPQCDEERVFGAFESEEEGFVDGRPLPLPVHPSRKRKRYASVRPARVVACRAAPPLPPPQPQAALAEAAQQVAERPFTPECVNDGSRCLARTWGGGKGGQCKSKPIQDGLCKTHLHSHAHGLVTGDIPPAKLRQFQARAE